MKKLIFAFLIILAGMTQTSQAQDGFIGEIRMFAGTYAPQSWAFCNGQTLQISENQALYSIIGTTYGGDGRTSFALPDLRGRVPIQPGQGQGLSIYQLGQKGGTETSVPNPPYSAVAGPGVTNNINTIPVNTQINNVQPYLGVNFIICLDGVYPPRY